MAATLAFYSDGSNGFSTPLSGSGLGFYGASFGSSVEVGSYQTTTYVTDANGTSQGPAADNVTWSHQESGTINGATLLELQSIPNKDTTLNIRFTNDTAVKTQNINLLIYDRVTTTDNASGVTTKIAEIIHPNDTEGATGSGDTAWHTASGSPGVPSNVSLAPSPGTSGAYPGGTDTSDRQDVRHDWYVALSASPDSIGSKTNYGLYVSLEYL